jgi:hypothetical protein
VKRAGYDEVERKGLVEDGGKKMVSPTTLRVRGIITHQPTTHTPFPLNLDFGDLNATNSKS